MRLVSSTVINCTCKMANKKMGTRRADGYEAG